MEIPSYKEIHTHIDVLGGMSTLKHKLIFSTLSKGITHSLVSFVLSPAATLCTVSCVLRFRTLTEGVEVTRIDNVSHWGNLLTNHTLS